jgi:diguanylate cyclase (GGDEF)-like protein
MPVSVPLDPLTGAGNLEALRRRFPDDASPVMALWVDVDGLIWFNDSEGHARGDEALATVAAWLTNHAKPLALQVFRVGGDEFVLAPAPGDTAFTDDAAAALADRLVDEAPSLELRFTGPRQPENDRDVLTVSVVVFRADASLATARDVVRSTLATRVYEAGVAAGRRFGRRA